MLQNMLGSKINKREEDNVMKDIDYDNLTDDEYENIHDQYEYFEEWLESDARNEGISLEEYDFNSRMRDYGMDMDDLDKAADDE